MKGSVSLTIRGAELTGVVRSDLLALQLAVDDPENPMAAEELFWDVLYPTGSDAKRRYIEPLPPLSGELQQEFLNCLAELETATYCRYRDSLVRSDLEDWEQLEPLSRTAKVLCTFRSRFPCNITQIAIADF